jgi:hypothetical protein
MTVKNNFLLKNIYTFSTWSGQFISSNVFTSFGPLWIMSTCFLIFEEELPISLFPSELNGNTFFYPKIDADLVNG